MRGLLFLALCGCGFEAVRESSDLAAADLTLPPSSDLAGVDLAVPDLALSTSTCAPPMLLVTIENLHNPATGGGRVARLSLGDGMRTPLICTTLSAQGLMTPQPFSVAAVSGRLAVAGRDSFQLLDPQTDTILWSKPVGVDDFPVDAFALGHPDGRILAAVAYGTTHESPPLAIARVDGWALDGTLVKSWATNAVDLPLGLGVYGMTAHPRLTTHLLALDPINHAWGWDVDPWGAAKMSFLGEATGTPISISSVMWSTEIRTVWVDDTAPTSVFYNNDANGPSILGPIRCAGCTLLHAVPDPTINTRFFGLCDGPGVDSRRVVRFASTGGTCDTVLEGAGFGAESRLSRLALSP